MPSRLPSPPRASALPTLVVATALVADGLTPAGAAAQAFATTRSSVALPATRPAALVGDSATREALTPACDTAPPVRWADQFRRRRALALPAVPTVVARRPVRAVARTRAGAPVVRAASYRPAGGQAAHAVTRPAPASVTAAVPGPRPRGARSTVAVLPSGTGVRVGKSQIACAAPGGAGSADGALDTPAPSNAMAETFDAPLTGEVADAEVVPTAQPAVRGGGMWPRVGWGAIVVGGVGAAARPGGGSDAPAEELPTATTVGGPGGAAPAPPYGPEVFVPPSEQPLVPPGTPPSTPPGFPPGAPPNGSPPLPPGTPSDVPPGLPPGSPPGAPPDVPSDRPPPAPPGSTVPTAVVPEPASATLLALGLAVAGGALWRRRSDR